MQPIPYSCREFNLSTLFVGGSLTIISTGIFNKMSGTVPSYQTMIFLDKSKFTGDTIVSTDNGTMVFALQNPISLLGGQLYLV